MDLLGLKIFVALAENGSATKTARRLGMTQPGVSQHIAKLEDELGFKLFDRKGKKLEINDFGRDFLSKSRKILEEIDGLSNINNPEYCPIGSLKLGLTDSSTLTVIPPALVKFRKLFPGVHLSIDVSDSGEIEHGVLRGHYDLGVITAGDRMHPMLDSSVLYYDRIDAIVSKHHPLAKKRVVTLQQLSEYPLFVYPRRSRTRRIIDDGFHAQNVHPKELMDVYFNSGAGRLAEAGLGVAILSQAFIVGEMQKHKCVHLRIKGDPFQRAICLIRKRDTNLSDAAKGFYDILIKKPS